MINLLPPEEKANVMYARRNTHLRKWVIALVFVLIGMFCFLAVGHFYIAKTTERYTEQVSLSQESLKAQKLEETEKRLQDLSNNLKLIIQVLSREVLFSKLIRQIGAVMPQGSILSSIELSKVEGGIDLSAEAQDYDTATRIQVNLQDPSNKLFEKVDIVQVSCVANTTTGYPCKVTLRALFNKNNPYLFINNGVKK
jgi:Tfp pilus assembly protein PilN